MLCNTCSTIDLSSYFTREISVKRDAFGFIQPDSSAIDLGTLEEVFSRSSECRFCHLVLSAVTHRSSRREWHAPEWFLELSQNAEVFGRQCLLYSYKFVSNVPQECAEATNEGYRLAIGLQPNPGMGSDYLHHAGEIQLEGLQHFAGRLMNPRRIDFELAKGWLALCESKHVQTCEVPALDPETATPDRHPENVFVIDVLEMRLRPIPKGARYLALSYCWPSSTSAHFQTTKAVLDELLTPGALQKRMEDLPSVIQDAILFTAEFNEQYLWVDALCIVQDDLEQKQSQIEQMDLVYGSAILTIICAHPQPLDETYLGLDGFRMGVSKSEFNGLPGYRSGSRICRQLVEEIDGLRLSVPFTSVDMAVRYSRWDNRAWTFQEHRLSRRKLFFTELQLYFQCSCAVFCEDTVSEDVRLTSFIYGFSNLWNPCGIGTRIAGSPSISTWLSRSPMVNSIQAVTTYKRLFDQYSHRNMTNAGDVVFAFQGIMKVLRRTLKTDFVGGLPERYLHEGLLWMGTGPQTRRAVRKADNEMVLPYPSWTWAGWSAPALYAYVFEGLVYGEVEWFVVDDDEDIGPVRLDTPGAYDEVFDPFDAEKCNIRAGDLPSEILKTLRSREQLVLSDGHWNPSQHLACWTTVAEFEMSGDTFPLNGYAGIAFEDCWNVIIFDRRGEAAGAIVLRRDVIVPLVEENKMFEYMLLSRSHEPSPYLKFFDEKFYAKRGWCYINVMLIKRSGDVVSRLGVGVIHEDAWIAANPKPKMIKLD
jgi:hypothetical protein